MSIQSSKSKPWYKWVLALIFPLLIGYFSYRMTILSIPYLQMKPDVDFLKTKYNVYHKDYWRIGFYAHVFTSVIVLLAGITQFNTFFIFKKPKWHKRFGYVYIWLVLFVSGPGAMAMALHANGGPAAQSSFILQTTMWYIFTIGAWYYIMKRKWTRHAEAMLLSYSLTLAAITLRIMVWLLGHYKIPGLRPREAYIMVSWMSWVPNMIIAGLLIHFGFVRWYFKKGKT